MNSPADRSTIGAESGNVAMGSGNPGTESGGAGMGSRNLGAQSGNVGPAERWISVLSGLGLLLSATRGRGFGRLARTSVALPLLARGATGYCAMKAAFTGQSSMGDGLKEQWRRLSSSVGSVVPRMSAAKQIDSMQAMYELELQELHSAEMQLCDLARELGDSVTSASLSTRIREYAMELDARRAHLETLLAQIGASPGMHPDDAMQALIAETNKMRRVHTDKVRDSALLASLQRIIHYKIAGYGTIAAYAKSLGRMEEAGHFAQLADREKELDAQLSELAKRALNPEAVLAPQEQAPSPQARPH